MVAADPRPSMREKVQVVLGAHCPLSMPLDQRPLMLVGFSERIVVEAFPRGSSFHERCLHWCRPWVELQAGMSVHPVW